MSIPILKTGDIDLISAVVNSMIALMGSTYTSSNANVTISNGTTTANVTVADKFNNGYTVNQRDAGPMVSVTPFGVSLGPGETQQFTATVTEDGVPVVGAVIQFAVTQGTGTVTQTGLYTAPAVIATGTFDVLVCTDTVSGSSFSLTINLHP